MSALSTVLYLFCTYSGLYRAYDEHSAGPLGHRYNCLGACDPSGPLGAMCSSVPLRPAASSLKLSYGFVLLEILSLSFRIWLPVLTACLSQLLTV